MDLENFDYNKLKLLAMSAPAGKQILETCMDIASMLVSKNISYGNSALNPIKIFSKINSAEQIQIRIDDKLNRIKNSQNFPGDNDLDDLIGYLILLKIAKSNAN